jgi:hypothetical protein
MDLKSLREALVWAAILWAAFVGTAVAVVCAFVLLFLHSLSDQLGALAWSLVSSHHASSFDVLTVL